MPKMVTLREAAAQTGLSYSCLRRWILEGKFTGFVKSGTKYFVNLAKLEAFLDNPS